MTVGTLSNHCYIATIIMPVIRLLGLTVILILEYLKIYLLANFLSCFKINKYSIKDPHILILVVLTLWLFIASQVRR